MDLEEDNDDDSIEDGPLSTEDDLESFATPAPGG